MAIPRDGRLISASSPKACARVSRPTMVRRFISSTASWRESFRRALPRKRTVSLVAMASLQKPSSTRNTSVVEKAARSTVRLEAPTLRLAGPFLEAVRRSRTLHRGLVSPPNTRDKLRVYVERVRRPEHFGHFVRLQGGELAGVINVTEVVRGSFRSAYLGYYAFVPCAGQGYMKEGLRLVMARAFGKYRLHRLEANIQPRNAPSIALVKSLGFRLEGFSPKYLRIAGRWRDHERWAITVEDWRARRL
jgi:[ribosomal protein S5]-alanine N-acetyltransferase